MPQEPAAIRQGSSIHNWPVPQKTGVARLPPQDGYVVVGGRRVRVVLVGGAPVDRRREDGGVGRGEEVVRQVVVPGVGSADG